jgi:ParB family chromosome partitioning protein
MTVQTSGLVNVAVAAIQVNGWNPRKRFDEAALAELAASVRQVGVLQPLLVRPQGDGYELVAGERRLRAARAVALEFVPCVVRELTDEQALEVAVLENLQRQDVAPWEEAAGFQRLIEAGPWTPDSLAQRLGKSREHVYGRLRLLKLHKTIQAALESGKLEASVAGLLSKFPVELQPAILKRVVDQPFRWAKGEVEREFRPLSRVPWRTAKGEEREGLGGDAKTARWSEACGRPDCSGCVHNSRNMPDVESAKEVCLDAACYGEKQRAWGKLRLADAQTRGLPVVELTFMGGSPAAATGYVLPDRRDYTLPEKGGKYLTWGEWLAGTGYVFPLAQDPESQVVLEVVKVSEARALLIARGKLKLDKAKVSGGVTASPEERKLARAQRRSERELAAAVGADCALKAGELSERDALAFVVAAWLRPRPTDSLVQALGMGKTDRYEELDGVTCFALLRKLDVPSLTRCLVRDKCFDGKEWNDWQLQQIEDLLGVRRDVVKNRLEVAAKAEAEGEDDDDAPSGRLSPVARAKIMAATKARWAKVRAKAALKGKGKAVA